MSILALVILSLAIWHYVYQGIICPSLHCALRNRLFALRDELRRMRYSAELECPDEAFDIVHTGLNIYANRLQLIDLGLMVKVNRLCDTDRNFAEQVDHRRRIVEATKNQKLLGIIRRADDTLALAVAANHGGWAIYIVPIVLFVVCASRLFSFAKDLVALPDTAAAKLMPLPESRTPAIA